MTSWSC